MKKLNGKAPHASGGPFRTGVIDPPWPYKKVTTTGNNLSGYVEYAHRDETRTVFRTLTIADLRSLPVGELISGYAFLWCPNPFLPAGLDLLAAWGFQYATAIHWRKTTKLGKVTYGAGFWYRGAAETILVAKKPGVESIRTQQRNLFDAVRPKGHSTKPEEFQTHVEKYFPGPYVELFARRDRPNWTCLGNECPSDGDDIRVSLPKLIPAPRKLRRTYGATSIPDGGGRADRGAGQPAAGAGDGGGQDGDGDQRSAPAAEAAPGRSRRRVRAQVGEAPVGQGDQQVGSPGERAGDRREQAAT